MTGEQRRKQREKHETKKQFFAFHGKLFMTKKNEKERESRVFGFHLAPYPLRVPAKKAHKQNVETETVFISVFVFRAAEHILAFDTLSMHNAIGYDAEHVST